MTVSRLGVVGAGTMGAGIAQLGCLGGYEVTLHDPDPQALASGADRLQRRARQGRGQGPVELPRRQPRPRAGSRRRLSTGSTGATW